MDVVRGRPSFFLPVKLVLARARSAVYSRHREQKHLLHHRSHCRHRYRSEIAWSVLDRTTANGERSRSSSATRRIHRCEGRSYAMLWRGATTAEQIALAAERSGHCRQKNFESPRFGERLPGSHGRDAFVKRTVAHLGVDDLDHWLRPRRLYAERLCSGRHHCDGGLDELALSMGRPLRLENGGHHSRSIASLRRE